MSSDQPTLRQDEPTKQFFDLLNGSHRSLRSRPPAGQSQLPTVVLMTDPPEGDGDRGGEASPSAPTDPGPRPPMDLFDHAIDGWASMIGINRPAFKATLEEQAHEMVRKLEAEGEGSEVERHLVELVVLSRMQFLYWENMQAKMPDPSPEIAAYKLKKSKSAMQKWVQSLESLVRIRSIIPSKVVVQRLGLATAPSSSPQDSGEGARDMRVLPASPVAEAKNISRTMAAIEQPKPKRLKKKIRSDLGSGSIKEVVARDAGTDRKRRPSTKTRKPS